MSPDWRIVEREQSDLIVERCRLLGEGWNSHVYLVNEEFVFRFPKRQAVWTELQRELCFSIAWRSICRWRSPGPGRRAGLSGGDVNVGDPDYDFVYTHLDFGWAFTEATARRYGRATESGRSQSRS